MFIVKVPEGFDSIELETLDEAKEYGFESNCKFAIWDTDQKAFIYHFDPEEDISDLEL